MTQQIVDVTGLELAPPPTSEPTAPARSEAVDPGIGEFLLRVQNLSLYYGDARVLEDISLDIENRKLTVTAERTAAEKVEGTTWHRREQRTGKWSRTIQLPESADQGNVEAVYKQGILHVTIGKHPKSKPQKIQIKGS